jgi:hypothetical protein
LCLLHARHQVSINKRQHSVDERQFQLGELFGAVVSPFSRQPASIDELPKRLRISAITQTQRVVHALAGTAVLIRHTLIGAEAAGSFSLRQKYAKPFTIVRATSLLN